MNDLPEELDQMPENTPLAETLSRVFGGAEVVGFHPEKGLVAAWYGGTGFNVYDPTGWFESTTRNRFGKTEAGHGPSGESGEVYYFNTTDPSRLDDPEENARETLEGYGFEVVGE